MLVALGARLSADVVRHMPDQMVEKLTSALSNMAPARPAVRKEIINELIADVETRRQTYFGGTEFAHKVLAQVVGPDKAEEIISRLLHRERENPFSFLTDVDPAQLSRFLKDEHPQTNAMILAHLPPLLSARIFASLPEESQAEIANRIGVMDSVSPDVIKTVERGLRGKLAMLLPQEGGQDQHIGGVNFLVQVLNHVDRATEKSLIDELSRINPDLAEQVQAQMFVFEDLILLDQRSLELVMREVDKKDLVLALRGATDEVKEAIFRSISKRAAQMIEEDLAVMGPVRLRNVEEAQKRIVMVVRRLEENEQIVISRGGSSDILI